MSSALEFIHLPILYPVHIDVLNVPLLRQRPRVALTHEELHRRGVHVQAALLGAVTKLLGVLTERVFSLSLAYCEWKSYGPHAHNWEKPCNLHN